MQHEASHAADPRPAGSEGERIGQHGEDHRDQRRDGEGGHHGVADVLLADHAAVEQAEARDRHHQDERHRGQHPGGVAGIVGALLEHGGRLAVGGGGGAGGRRGGRSSGGRGGGRSGGGRSRRRGRAGGGRGRGVGGRGRRRRLRQARRAEPDQRGDRQRWREAGKIPKQLHMRKLHGNRGIRARRCPFRRCGCARRIPARRRRFCRRRSGRCGRRRRSRRSLCQPARPPPRPRS